MTKIDGVRERALLLQAMFRATEQKLRKALELLKSCEQGAVVDCIEGAKLMVSDAEALLLSAHADELAALGEELERLRVEFEKPRRDDGNAMG